MDRTDRKIINFLQEDAKLSTRELGRRVGLTAPAVAERIQRLRASGVIEGFHAQVNESLLGSNLSAFVQVNVPPKLYERFCLFCLEEEAIAEHHHIIGLNNALLRIRVSSSRELDALLEKIRGFGLSNTAIVLSSYFARKPFSEKTGGEE